MDALAFLTDAPDSLTLAAGQATSRVQIAKTGKFKDPRYGKFTITRDQFATWTRNFTALSLSDGRAGLPIDVDHSPEKKGETEAAGWITQLDSMGKDGKTPTPDELWATAQWNSLGQELIRDRRYAYLSPSYQHNYEDETGKKHGTALVGVGLTNRPFLSMAVVSLSKADPSFATVDDEVEPPASDSRAAMPITKILTALKLDESLEGDAAEAAILSAVGELAKPAAPAPAATDKTLDQLAGEAGKIVLDAADFATLKTDAASGADAAKELKQSKFDAGFATALSEGRVTPAQEENLQAFYDKDAAATLSLLTSLPVAINMTGRGKSGSEVPGGTDHTLDAEGVEVDERSAAIDAKAVQLMAADPKLEYGDAVLQAAQIGA